MAEEKKQREPLFSPKNKKLIFNPISKDNPITVQVLGICSALAVTAKLEPAVVMSISVTGCTGICQRNYFFVKKYHSIHESGSLFNWL